VVFAKGVRVGHRDCAAAEENQYGDLSAAHDMKPSCFGRDDKGLGWVEENEIWFGGGGLMGGIKRGIVLLGLMVAIAASGFAQLATTTVQDTVLRLMGRPWRRGLLRLRLGLVG